MKFVHRLRHTMIKRHWKLTLALWLALAANANAGDLTVLADSSSDMPYADVQADIIHGGLHWDLGRALAQNMNRTAKFLLLPRKRTTAALETGKADLMCFYQPEWLPGAFDWSVGFIPNQDLLVTAQQAKRPANIAALAGQPIGTVLGFSYPELSSALGDRFIRDEAPHNASSLAKLGAGRMQHAVVSRAFLEYKTLTGEFTLPLHPYIVLTDQKSRCVVSRHGTVTVAQVNTAIEKLVADGTMTRLFNRYRPAAK